MSDKINDGGPAFPRPAGGNLNGTSDSQEGMTLRDYFAAKAMQAMIGCYYSTLRATDADVEDRNSEDYTTFDRQLGLDQSGITGEYEGATEIASDAYIYADSMLKAREAK